MRSIVIIATVLAISLAIPAGLLLTGTWPPSQSTEPEKGKVRDAMVQAPGAPEPKKNMVVKSPRESVSVNPPVREIVLPPKLPGAQPPQQPVQAPQIPQLEQRPVIEVKPPSYVFKGAMVSLLRSQAKTEEGVRARLTDADLTPFLQMKELHGDVNRTISLKQAFEEINTKMTRFESCPIPGEGPFCFEKPMMYLELTENQTITLVNLANPLLNSTATFREEIHANGDYERSWDASIMYNGIRYVIEVDSLWGRQ